MNIGLTSLIHPLTVTEFLEKYESNVPVILHHQQKYLKPLFEVPMLSSLETLLQSWPATIQAHLPDLRDESSSIDTNGRDARKLFSNGMGLLFNEAHNYNPLLKTWLEKLRLDLGLSALTYGRCLVYATPAHKGTAPHFDQNINFVLQIHGTKTWHLAPNQHLQNPLTRHTMGTTPDPEMLSYLEQPLPTTMPSDTETVVLNPGSFLFVPRGYWHSTEAQTDALALNFTFTPPTWLDLFTAALRSRLSLSTDWREIAHGVSDPARREIAEEHLDVLLSSIIDDLPNWQAADILNSTDELNHHNKLAP